MTVTPPQEQESPTTPTPTVSPTPTSAPASDAACTVTANGFVVQVVVTAAEAGPNALNVNVYEYGTNELAGKATLRIPGPVTAGETVSATGGPNALMTSCAVAGVAVTS